VTHSVEPTVKISIVIPAFNEERELGRTLASIADASRAFAAAGIDSEVVVCDNNSTDRTAAIAAAAGARVVFEPVNQIARARNTGAAHATGDWLVFVDADSRPSRALFAGVAKAIAAGDVLAGGSTIAFDRDTWAVRMAVGTWNLISRMARWGAGSFIFCEAAAFHEAGGFSQELYAAEEIDLFVRLKRFARASRRRILILTGHPIVTSARKVHLYSPREFASFHLKTVLSGGRALRRAEGCPIWYDGRR